MSLSVGIVGLPNAGKNTSFDAVVVLGSSFVKKDGQYNLGFAGRLRIMAAAELLKQKKCSNLVLSGGKTKGERELSEAKVMLNFLEEKYRGKIDSKKVFLEEEAKDTSANINNSIKLCTDMGWKKIAFLSNEFHCKRVNLLIMGYGLKVQFISAEAILRQFGDKHLIKQIENYYKSPDVMLIKALEVLFCWSLFFDKKGRIGNFTAQVFRG